MKITHAGRPDGGYTKIPNAWVRDPTLSLRGSRVLFYLASHAEGYDLPVSQMIAETGLSQRTIKAALQDLEDHKLLQRRQERNPDGTHGEVTYIVGTGVQNVHPGDDQDKQ